MQHALAYLDVVLHLKVSCFALLLIFIFLFILANKIICVSNHGD